MHGSTLDELLYRLQPVTSIFAEPSNILHPLALSISMGTCEQLRDLCVNWEGDTSVRVSAQELDCLGSAIKTGALPALRVLQIYGEWEFGGV